MPDVGFIPDDVVDDYIDLDGHDENHDHVSSNAHADSHYQSGNHGNTDCHHDHGAPARRPCAKASASHQTIARILPSQIRESAAKYHLNTTNREPSAFDLESSTNIRLAARALDPSAEGFRPT